MIDDGQMVGLMKEVKKQGGMVTVHATNGDMIDALIASGAEEPYTVTLITFTALSSLAIPCFWVAGRRFKRDRDRLYERAGGDSA